MRAFSVVHQQRSGGHAVISWLMCHYPRSVFSNANRWRGPDYKVSMIWNVASPVRDTDLMIRKSTKGILPEDEAEFTAPGERDRSTQSWRPVRRDLLVLSYEGKPVHDGWAPYVPEAYGPVEEHRRIVIVRSFYNTMASKLAWPEHLVQVAYQPKDIATWKAHARLNRHSGWDRILFDFWPNFTYRRHVEATLSLPVNCDDTIDVVNKFGSGSSFDKRKFNGEARAMRIRDRYKQVELPPEVLADSEAAELNHQLFGWCLNLKGEVVL